MIKQDSVEGKASRSDERYLFIIDFPYALFTFMRFFNHAPKYYFRIAYIFIDIASTCVMIVLYQFTDSLKKSIMKKFNQRTRVIVAAPALL